MDRLDLVMQAFEYEKRDNCIKTHQEFFDSNDGKFNHPLVIDLVNEIKAQREAAAKEDEKTEPNHVSANSSWLTQSNPEFLLTDELLCATNKHLV